MSSLTVSGLTPLTVAGYTRSGWEDVLAWVRVVAPLRQAGIRLLHGNEGAAVNPELVAQADVVLIQRDFGRDEAAYDQVIAAARAGGKPVVVDLDDLLLELPPDHPERDNYYRLDSIVPTLRAVVEADCVTVSTPELGRYVEQLNPNVRVLPNYLDDSLWPLDPTPLAVSDAPVVIGFMGSRTHIPDLSQIAGALVRILERYGERVRLRFWCCDPPGELAGHPLVEVRSLDLPYPQFVGAFCHEECDVFIAPLADTLFNRCKSNLKYLEYSARAIPGVYGRVTPFDSVVEHGVNGYLAGNADEWEACLASLIEQPDLRMEMGQRAQDMVRQEWLLSARADAWADLYASVRPLAPAPGAAPDRGLLVRQARRHQHETEQAATRAIIQSHLDTEEALRGAIQELRDQVATCVVEQARLQQELGPIVNSRVWRVAGPVMVACRRLAPPGSRRNSVLRKIFDRLFRTSPGAAAARAQEDR